MLWLISWPVLARSSCDKACLEEIANRYRAAYIKHDAKAAPISSTVRFTENNVEMAFPDGSWDAVTAEVRIYNPLFSKPDPTGGEGFAADLNPQSLEVLSDARVEPALAAGSSSAEPVQFERQGYFVHDPDSKPDRPVFNRTVGLRDTFAKEVGGKA